MAEAAKNGKFKKVPEFLREPIEAAQARLADFEEEAQKVLKDLIAKGKESRKEIGDLVNKLASQKNLDLEDVRGRFEKWQKQGVERAHELYGRTEEFRSDALHRLEEVQRHAVQFLGVATRDQVEELSRELHRLARIIEGKGGKKKAVKKTPKAEA